MTLFHLPLLPKRLPGLGVDEFRERFGISVIADMPGLEPGELCVAWSGARFSDLARAKIDGIGEDCRQQGCTVLRRDLTLEVRDVTG